MIPFYERFLHAYPTVEALARAPLRDVLEITEPLGYKIRGRWLKAIALEVCERRAGYFPRTLDELQEFDGVGRYTAGAVMSFAYGEDAPILDTNVRRVLGRYFGVEATAQAQMWRLASGVIPRGQAYRVNQALMDLGALVCVARAPRCAVCPLVRGCTQRRQVRTPESPSRPAPSGCGRLPRGPSGGRYATRNSREAPG